MRQRELATLFDFTYWAHSRVLVTATRLTDAQFTLRSVIAGRDLRATLVHTLDSEWSWRLRLQRRPEKDWRTNLPIASFTNVATLADRWKRDEVEMRDWVASLDDEMLARDADLSPTQHYPLWYYLMHIVAHSQQHRSEAAQLLTQLGQSPGDLDFLDYADWARASG